MDWIRGFRVRLFHLYVFEEPGAGKWDRWFRLVGLRLCSLVFSVWVIIEGVGLQCGLSFSVWELLKSTVLLASLGYIDL